MLFLGTQHVYAPWWASQATRSITQSTAKKVQAMGYVWLVAISGPLAHWGEWIAAHQVVVARKERGPGCAQWRFDCVTS